MILLLLLLLLITSQDLNGIIRQYRDLF